MKSKGHVYMAHLLYEELLNNDGWLTIRTVSDADGRYEEQRYRLEDPIYWAIRDQRACFLAGAVGPDYFPDMLNGQMRIHPRGSGQWLEMMFEELRKINPNTLEFQKAVAFYMGWLMHYCTDMYTHQYVNRHSFGWFPSIAQMRYDLEKLTGSDQVKTLAACAYKYLSDEEGQKLLADGDFSGCASKLLANQTALEEFQKILTGQTNYKDFGEYETAILAQIDGAIAALREIREKLKAPDFDRKKLVAALQSSRSDIVRLMETMDITSEEKPQILEGLDTAIAELSRTDAWVDKVMEKIDLTIEGLDDYKPQKFIIKLLEDAIHLVRLANSALNIVRHMLIESYLDSSIQKGLEKQKGYDRHAYYSLEIPDDFIRRCFTTPDAYRRMLKLSHDDLYRAEDNPLDVLGKYVEFYEQEFQKMLATGGDQKVLEDLQIRANCLNRWVELWRKFVMNDLVFDSPIPDGQKWQMVQDIWTLVTAYFSEEESSIRDAEDLQKHLDRLYGLARPMGPAIEGMLELAGEFLEEILLGWVDPLLEQILLWNVKPLLEGLKDLVTPVLQKTARYLVEQGGYPEMKDSAQVTGFDKSLEVIEHCLENPRLFLQCEALFREEDLADRFDEEWKHLGQPNIGCFDLECPMLENALQMGKLCLIGSHDLNELFAREVGSARPFHSSDVRWTVSRLLVEVLFPNGGFTQKGTKLQVDVYRKNDKGGSDIFHKAVIWDGRAAFPKESIKAEIPLTEALTAQELTQCILKVSGTQSRRETVSVKVNLYDKDTGLLLFSEQGSLSNMDGSQISLLPPDQRQREKTFREQYEQSRLVNSLHKLRVTVQTGSDGTDSNVLFVVLGEGNKTLTGPFNLDRGGAYNDFEANITDTYEVTLPQILDVDQVTGFGIYRDSDTYDWQVNRIRVGVDVDGYGHVVIIADRDHGDQSINADMVIIPLDQNRLKAPELGLIREIRELQVDIRTAAEWWAGTDHHVYMEVMKGTKTLKRVELDQSGRNDFERANLDATFVSIMTGGKGIMSNEITSFRLSKEKGGWLHEDDWTVEQVAVHDADSGLLLGLYTTKPGEKSFVFTSGNNKLSFSR